MNKLKIFSEKLGEALEVSFREDGTAVTPEGVEIGKSGIVFAWNNYTGSWVDQGWNNYTGSWQDKGWNNYTSSWVDKGWNNYTGSWQDKGWSNSTGSWGDAGGSGSGCFITTACVENKGFGDDCMELQTLRQYRDILVNEDEEFRSKVLEYYRKAPLIVQEIENSGESTKIYDELYDVMIRPCVTMLKEGRIEEAKLLYLDCYDNLTERFLVE